MKKIHKTWRLPCGALSILVLFSAVVFLVSWYSPDAKLKRAVQEIISESGFEYVSSIGVYKDGVYIESDVTNGYSADPIRSQKADQILALLDRACPSCSTELVRVGEDYLPLFPEDTDSGIEIFYLNAPEGMDIRRIIINFDDQISSTDGSPHASFMSITLARKGGRWSLL